MLQSIHHLLVGHTQYMNVTVLLMVNYATYISGEYVHTCDVYNVGLYRDVARLLSVN